MTKLVAALVTASIALGLNSAIANAADASAKDWSDFQSAANKCNGLTGAQRDQCMTAAGDKYRSSNFNCDTMSGTDKAQCQKYNDEWKSAKSDHPQGDNAAVRSGDANPIPADPGDPTDKERNRDSTKQQENAPQPQKQ